MADDVGMFEGLEEYGEDEIRHYKNSTQISKQSILCSETQTEICDLCCQIINDPIL